MNVIADRVRRGFVIGCRRGAEIRHILGRVRSWYLREHQRCSQELEWTQPGWVWAMDHTQATGPLDGTHNAVFALRDLASGAQLSWQPQRGAKAGEVVEALKELFERHGAPLVLKSDNGSAFVSSEVVELCKLWQVKLLFSPPRSPGYNGSIESSIRWLKERTDHAACRRGEQDLWRQEDLQVALDRTDELPKDSQKDPRPRHVVFSQRKLVPPQLRGELGRRLRWEKKRERDLNNHAPQAQRTRAQRAAIERTAMRRALVALGILTITTRRVSPTLKSMGPRHNLWARKTLTPRPE